jgi:predicted RNase H-like nuclease (RuvC/YqgF family)
MRPMDSVASQPGDRVTEPEQAAIRSLEEENSRLLAALQEKDEVITALLRQIQFQRRELERAARKQAAVGMPPHLRPLR